MPSNYDVAIVGGGLAGSSLALALAKRGTDVVVLEREPQFRDRVRGEGMLPWGAAEARELGVHEPLLEACAIEARWWTAPDDNRDLVETTPSRLGCLNFYHPEMQQVLLDLAVAAGVQLRRPADVIAVHPVDRPGIVFREDGTEQKLTARLVVERTAGTRGCVPWPDFLATASRMF
jgi:2-polyprenyl-6-methoxyphenol hydroxylase-like FAD-dependent oxidoreductase